MKNEVGNWLIYAYEGLYGGLYGMNYIHAVANCSYDEAEELATEMSYDVMDSYTCIMEELEEMADAEVDDRYSYEWDSMLNDIMQENVEYTIYRLRDDVKIDDIDFNNDIEDLVEMYCVKEG